MKNFILCNDIIDNMKTEKCCGCIVLKGNEVLLIGSRNDKGELFWSFPKGHQEMDETDIETAIRETKEETGIDVEIADMNPIETGYFIRGGAAYKKILLFIAKPLNEALRPQEGEVEQVKWTQIDAAEKFFTDYYSDAWEELLKRFGNG